MRAENAKSLDTLSRVVGLAIVATFLLGYDRLDDGVLAHLLMPIALILGAWLILRGVPAIALAVALLAFAHTDLGSSQVSPALTYPAIAACAGVVLIVSLVGRFRRHIEDTRTERWNARHE